MSHGYVLVLRCPRNCLLTLHAQGRKTEPSWPANRLRLGTGFQKRKTNVHPCISWLRVGSQMPAERVLSGVLFPPSLISLNAYTPSAPIWEGKLSRKAARNSLHVRDGWRSPASLLGSQPASHPRTVSQESVPGLSCLTCSTRNRNVRVNILNLQVTQTGSTRTDPPSGLEPK